jgi:hypothetical protein
MKNAFFWDVMPCGSCKKRRSGGTYRLHHQGEKNQPARNNVSSNWRRYISLTHRFLEKPHGVISQNTAFFKSIIIAVINLPIAPALELEGNRDRAIIGMSEWQGKPKYCRSVRHRSHMTYPGLELGPPRREAGD